MNKSYRIKSQKIEATAQYVRLKITKVWWRGTLWNKE